jgi:diadenosine tetraphosphate (Ap4A) HIT family hydrolase
VHRFETILRDPHRASAPWDRVLDESPSFVVFPSLGSLVPGWVLIVPRRPLLNLSGLTGSEWNELGELQARVGRRLSSFGDRLFLFEHGNRMVGGALGCGVDQAHLHIVPLPFDLLQSVANNADNDIVWSSLNGASSFREAVLVDTEYVSIMNPSNREAIVGKVLRPKSQWVRRVIAGELGCTKGWDYKRHPNLHNLLGTVAGYNAA